MSARHHDQFQYQPVHCISDLIRSVKNKPFFKKCLTVGNCGKREIFKPQFPIVPSKQIRASSTNFQVKEMFLHASVAQRQRNVSFTT